MKTRLQIGFTLIEVMVAMAILAVMSVLIYTSTTQTITGKEETTKRDNLNHSAALALNRMAGDLQMAFLLNGPEFLGTEGKIKTVFVGKEDKVDFPTLSRTRYFKESKEADFGEVGYSLENSKEENGGKILVRRDAKRLDDKPEEGGVIEPLVEGVKEIHFEYYDAKKKEWTKNWDSSQLEFNNTLPRAVKIEIKVEDPESEDPLTYSTIADIKIYAQPISF